MINRKRIATLGLALIATISTGLLSAQSAQNLRPQPTTQAEAQRIADVRHAFFVLMEYHNSPLGYMLQGRTLAAGVPAGLRATHPLFDPQIFVRQLGRLEQGFQMIPELFEQNTSSFQVPAVSEAAAITTAASSRIWSNFTAFTNIANTGASAARQFMPLAAAATPAAATSTSVGRPPASISTFYLNSFNSPSCSACHDQYRGTTRAPDSPASGLVFNAGEYYPQPVNAGQAQWAADFHKSYFIVVDWLQEPLVSMANGQLAYDSATVVRQAQRIDSHAQMLAELLLLDTRAYSANIQTVVKDAAWADPAAIATLAADLSAAARALGEAATAAATGTTVPAEVAAAWNNTSAAWGNIKQAVLK